MIDPAEYNSDILMSQSDRQEALDDLLFRAALETAGQEVFGSAALALVVSQGVSDPNRIIQSGAAGRTLLLGALTGLNATSRTYSSAPRAPQACLDISLDPNALLPHAASALPVFERLALWLIRAGADPWIQDAQGQDALDLALTANARTTVRLLLSHPNRPSQAALETRKTSLSGRATPWMHALAYEGFVDLFDDLAHAGWNPESLDRNGWTPAAWVNRPEVLERVLDHHSDPGSVQLSVDLNAAWARRALQKTHDNHFKLAELTKVLSSRTTLTSEGKEALRLQKIVEEWIAATPSKQSYSVPGVKWTCDAAKDENVEAIDLMTKYFDRRFQTKSRTAKGSWSPLGAALWALRRGESDSNAAAGKFSPVLVQVLSAQPEQARLAWLNEEITPRLTNRGLALWSLADRCSPEATQFLSQGLSSDHADQERMKATTNATVVMANNSSERTWRVVLADKWLRSAQSENMFSGTLPNWVWPHLRALSRKKLLTLAKSDYQRLVQRAAHALDERDPAPEVLSAVPALLAFTAPSLSDVTNNWSNESAEFVAQLRLRLWKSLNGLIADHPELSAQIPSKAYPFTDLASDIEKGKSEFPSSQAWKSWLDRSRLMGVSTKASDTSSSRPRPKM